MMTEHSLRMLAEELMVSVDAVADMVADLSQIGSIIGQTFGIPEVLAAASGAYELLNDDAQAEAQS